MIVNGERGILDKIITIKEHLPAKQKKLCDYILENHSAIEPE